MVLNMTPSQVQVINPILSDKMLGFLAQDDLWAWSELFPPCPVDQSSGQLLKFGKEHFMLYNLDRAPGGTVATVNFEYSGEQYVLKNRPVDCVLPREYIRDAQQVPGIDLGAIAVKRGSHIVGNDLEWEAAQLAQSLTSYDPTCRITLVGTNKFSNAASDIIALVDAGREAVRKLIGRYPNVGVFGPTAFNAAKNHPTIRGMFSAKDNQDIVVNEAMLAAAFSLKRVKNATATYATTANAPFTDMWGNVFILGYVPNPMPMGQLAPNQMNNQPVQLGEMIEPSYGYTYIMRGHPAVEEPVWNSGRRSWVYPTSFERAPQVTSLFAGYLFQGVA